MRFFAVCVLTFALGALVGVVGSTLVLTPRLHRQAQLTAEVLARADQALKHGTKCQSALEGLWEKIEAGREVELRLTGGNGNGK